MNRSLTPGAVARAVALEALRDAWAVLAPTQCSGCGAPDRALCAACRLAIDPLVRRIERDGQPVWCSLDYSGVARRVIGAYKDGGRTDAASALAPALRQAIIAALAAGQPGNGTVHLVTIPSSRAAWRIRGYHPVELLLKRARLRSTPVLRQVGEARDQVGLQRAERMRNKSGSLVATRSAEGLCCVIVDDIVTTGATLCEARRAVIAGGGTVLGMAALAETPRRHPVPPPPASPSQQTGRQML
ncbi:ComF family protein [Glaciibacter sp. 2TAF33]|uniref:ComF family protein n=1 Tax=Glaciibacter sp. 2TAF33 TaxID=3233015 RepID=UPI003F92B8DB